LRHSLSCVLHERTTKEVHEQSSDTQRTICNAQYAIE